MGRLVRNLHVHRVQCRLRYRGARRLRVEHPHDVCVQHAKRVVRERGAISQPHVQQRGLRLVERMVGQLRRIVLQCGLRQRGARRLAVGQPHDVRGVGTERIVRERGPVP